MNNPMTATATKFLTEFEKLAYQTPVFQGTKSECKNWVNEIVK